MLDAFITTKRPLVSSWSKGELLRTLKNTHPDFLSMLDQRESQMHAVITGVHCAHRLKRDAATHACKHERVFAVS